MPQQRLFVAGLATAVVLLLVLGAPLFLGQVYVKDDLGIFHLTTRYFYAQSLARGESFLWWPNIFSGFYLHGEGQVGMYHPLHLILYRVLPLETAFNLELLLSYPVILCGTWLFLRRWSIGRDGAIFGALVFTFSSFNFLQFVHPNIVAIVAHSPLLLLAIETVLTDSDATRIARAKLCIAVLTASQLLLGHPQAVWLSSLLEILYVMFRLPSGRGWRCLLSLAEAKSLGALAGCVQLLPTWDAASHSIRADPAFLPTYRFQHSLEPINLVQFIAPYMAETRAFGSRYVHEFGVYSGSVVPVLLLWLYLRRKALSASRNLVIAACVLGGLGIVLAMGKYGYIALAQEHIPFVKWFGVPVRYHFLLQFAVAVGCAVAFADLAGVARKRSAPARRELWPLAILPVASALVAGAALFVRFRPEAAPEIAAQLASPGYIVLGPALVAAASGLVYAAARGAGPALLGIVVFAAADQCAYGLSLLRSPFPPMALSAVIDGQAKPPEATSNRVYSNNNFLAMAGHRLAGGYAAMRPKGQLEELDAQRLRIANVEWVESRSAWARQALEVRPALDGEARVTHDALGRPATWKRISDPVPRARLVTRTLVTPAPADDVDAIEITAIALVPKQLGLDAGATGKVSVVDDKPGRIRLRAEVASRQLLILSESWHRGWRVRVNNAERPVVRVYGEVIGVVVEAGDDAIEFFFSPDSLRVGGWLSLAGVALMLLSYFVTTIRPGGRPA